MLKRLTLTFCSISRSRAALLLLVLFTAFHALPQLYRLLHRLTVPPPRNWLTDAERRQAGYGAHAAAYCQGAFTHNWRLAVVLVYHAS